MDLSNGFLKFDIQNLDKYYELCYCFSRINISKNPYSEGKIAFVLYKEKKLKTIIEKINSRNKKREKKEKIVSFLAAYKWSILLYVLFNGSYMVFPTLLFAVDSAITGYKQPVLTTIGACVLSVMFLSLIMETVIGFVTDSRSCGRKKR